MSLVCAISVVQNEHFFPTCWKLPEESLKPFPIAEKLLSFVAKLFGKSQLVNPELFNFPPAILLPPSALINSSKSFLFGTLQPSGAIESLNATFQL